MPEEQKQYEVTWKQMGETHRAEDGSLVTDPPLQCSKIFTNIDQGYAFYTNLTKGGGVTNYDTHWKHI